MNENGNSSLAPDLPPASSEMSPMGPSLIKRAFFGPNGLRACWRILIFILLVIALGRLLRLVWPSGSAPRGPNGEYLLEPIGESIARFRQFLIFVVASLVMAFIEHERWGNYGLPLRRVFSRDTLVGLVWGFVGLSFVMLGLWIAGAYRIESLALNGGAIWKFAALWGLMFILVGLLEEFIFRGYLQYALASGIGFWPASVITSALFLMAHRGNGGENWMGLTDVFIIGFFLCVTLWRTGDLWFAVAMHASWDWGLTYFYSAPNSGTDAVGQLFHVRLQGPTWLSGGSAGPEGSAINLVFDLIFFAVFLMIYKRRKWIGMTERRRAATSPIRPEPLIINPEALSS
jgi:membrane protease YdiL (CAAX protease family)